MAKNFIASAASVLIGVALVVFSGGLLAPVGVGLIISGVLSAAAIAFTPDQTEASNDEQSPTYGFAQFRNPRKGDTPIFVTYAADGIKTAPVWLQAFVTPRGMEDDDERRASRYQKLSGLLALGEGPITEVSEIRFNDEPVYETHDFLPAKQPDGSKKKWTLSQRRIIGKSVKVYVDDVQVANLITTKNTLLGTGNGSRTTWSFDIPDDIADDVPIRFYNIEPTRGGANLELWRLYGFQTWLVTKNRLIVHRDEPLGPGQLLYMRYGAYVDNGASVTKKNDVVTISFTTAPASNAELRVELARKNIPGMELYLRHGGAHQLPIWGFHAVRNSAGVQSTLSKGIATEKTTSTDVDDIIINLASGQSGFISYDDEGDSSGVKAQFKIEIERPGAPTGDTFAQKYRLPDPRGAAAGQNKNAEEFQVLGHSANQLFWAFSVRRLLEKYADQKNGKNKGAAARKAANDFIRGTYKVYVTRTNPVASDTNSKWYDELVFVAVTEVQDELLNLPGTALLGFHALGTERLNGSAPNVTCLLKGRRNVEKLVPTSSDPSGYIWTPGTENQSNRVWAAIDFITSKRFGFGEHYTKESNIDYASAISAAAFQEELVTKGPNTTDTEQRSRLNGTLDTRKALMQHLRNMLAPGRVWPVLRGNVWHFILDAPVTLVDSVGADAVPVLYDDTKLGRTAKNSLSFSHDTVASVATEVQLTFLDREKEFQREPIWVTPQEPGGVERRIHRADAWGITTESEANRYGLWIYHNLRSQGATIGVAAAPSALNWAAGTVIRVISNRVGINGYWRIWDFDFGTDTYFVKITGKQYDPAIYGQQVEKQRIIRDGFERLLAPPPPQITSPAASAPVAAKSGAASASTSTARRTRTSRIRRRKKLAVTARRVA